MGWHAGEVVASPYQTAINQLQTYLHNDDLARQQGLRGGVVGGPNIIACANVALERELGERWARGGRLRARFVSPVYHQDRVRALLTVLEALPAFRAQFTIENQDAQVVVRGEAALIEPSFEARPREPGESDPPERLLDLRRLRPGDRMPPPDYPWFRCTVTPDTSDVADYCERNQDPLARPDRVPLSYLPRMLFNPVRWWLDAYGAGPGMYGQVDIRQYEPLRPGKPYDYEAEVVSVGRRGNLERIEVEMRARSGAGGLACAVTHTHFFPHRDRATE